MEENSINLLKPRVSNRSVSTEKDVVQMVNELIILRQMSCPRVRSLTSLHAIFYSELFKNVFGYDVPDSISNPAKIEDDIHNVQCVIDTLSLDILSISLSHIMGEDIINKNPTAISNLLEVFKGYLDAIGQSNSSGATDFSKLSSSIVSQHLSKSSSKSMGKESSSTSSSSYQSTETSSTSSKDSTIQDPRSSMFHPSIRPLASIYHLRSNGNESDSNVETPCDKPLDTLYKKVFEKVPRRRVTPARRRSVLIPKCLRSPKKMENPDRQNPVHKTVPRVCGGYLSEINSALPGIQLSQQTTNEIRQMGVNHVKFMVSNLTHLQTKKRKAQKQLEDAIVKQRKILDMDKKDVEDDKRVAETKQAKKNQLKVQSLLTDCNIRKARMKKYYNNYHLRHRKRMSQKSTKEEVLLKNLFQERLALQKENLNEVRKQLRQEEQIEAMEQQWETETLANFYETQTSLIKEKIQKEKFDFNCRVNSQVRALEDFKRETRNKIQKEIEEIQDDLEKRDDFHFIETAADRLRQSWK